jgi:hypothetical protein
MLIVKSITPIQKPYRPMLGQLIGILTNNETRASFFNHLKISA